MAAEIFLKLKEWKRIKEISINSAKTEDEITDIGRLITIQYNSTRWEDASDRAYQDYQYLIDQVEKKKESIKIKLTQEEEKKMEITVIEGESADLNRQLFTNDQDSYEYNGPVDWEEDE